jgi:hypothetical protein
MMSTRYSLVHCWQLRYILHQEPMPIPKPDMAMIKKVKEFRSKGLTFRQIAKILEKDVKTIYRWASYSVGKLSTG